MTQNQQDQPQAGEKNLRLAKGELSYYIHMSDLIGFVRFRGSDCRFVYFTGRQSHQRAALPDCCEGPSEHPQASYPHQWEDVACRCRRRVCVRPNPMFSLPSPLPLSPSRHACAIQSSALSRSATYGLSTILRCDSGKADRGFQWMVSLPLSIFFSDLIVQTIGLPPRPLSTGFAGPFFTVLPASRRGAKLWMLPLRRGVHG
jgi:hypothetical protein